MPGFKLFDSLKEPGEALNSIFKDKPFEYTVALGCTHKSVMLVFGHINADNKILIGTGNIFADLTKLSPSDNFFITHNNLLLARPLGFSVWLPYAIRRLFLYLRDNNFSLCYAERHNSLYFYYITYIIL